MGRQVPSCHFVLLSAGFSREQSRGSGLRDWKHPAGFIFKKRLATQSPLLFSKAFLFPVLLSVSMEMELVTSGKSMAVMVVYYSFFSSPWKENTLISLCPLCQWARYCHSKAPH